MRLMLIAALFICAASPSLAQEVVEKADKLVIVPWGDWLVATAQTATQVMLPLILPTLGGAAIAAIVKTYPMAALFLTQSRVEMGLQALAEYGLNAVENAAKGQKLEVAVANDVLRAGVRYGIETMPGAVIKAAGGPEGLAKRLFRKLDIEPKGSEANVLQPSLNWLERALPGIVPQVAGRGRAR